MSEVGLEDNSTEWWSPAEHKAGVGGKVVLSSSCLVSERKASLAFFRLAIVSGSLQIFKYWPKVRSSKKNPWARGYQGATRLQTMIWTHL